MKKLLTILIFTILLCTSIGCLADNSIAATSGNKNTPITNALTPTEPDQIVKNSIDYTLEYNTDIDISHLNGWLIMEGTVKSIQERNRAEEIAHLYNEKILNYITVTAAEQVQLDIMVLEVDRDRVGDLGIIWGSNGIADGSTTIIPGTFYIGQGIKNPLASGLNLDNIGYASIQAKVKALTRQSHARVLSHPSVVTTNGTAAYINVGGSLPVPKGVGQNYAIDWKDYGIKLNVTPNILQGGKFVNTDISVEIVDIDPASLQNSVTISDGGQHASIPIFKKNNANANLNLMLGETMGLGGILSYEFNNDAQGVAGFSDIPFLGSLFKDTSQKHSSVDVIILVTPHVIYSSSTPEINGTEVAKKIDGADLYQNRQDDKIVSGILH